MSPKLASMGFSTAAERAWFDQEVTPEPSFLEQPTSQRRMLIVFAAAFLVIGSVLGVARATTQGSHGANVAAPALAPVPAPHALVSKKSTPSALGAPRTKLTPVAKSTAKKPAKGKAPAKKTHGKSGRGKSTRSAQHR